jgi:hypothetical protein
LHRTLVPRAGELKRYNVKNKYGKEMEKKKLDFKQTLQTKLDVLKAASEMYYPGIARHNCMSYL